MSSTIICRLCLNTNRRSYFINHTVLQETWERLTDAKFDPNDGRPLLVCYICCAQLRNSHELRKRALKAEELFTKYLTNNSFVDSKKLISLIVSNTYNNDYNYAIQEQHNLDCGQKVPEKMKVVKKEIEDDEVMNIEEEDGKMVFYEAVPVKEKDLVVDTISIKEEIEDVKEEINSESDMHDTVTETHADDEDALRKSSFQEIAQSDVSVYFEWIDTGVTAKKCNTEDLHQTAEHNVADEAIMERKSLNNISICQPKESTVTFDENISLTVHDTASNDNLNSYSSDKLFSCKLCKYECFTKTSYNIHLRKQHAGEDKACVSDLCDYGASDNDNLNKQVMHEHKKEELFSYYKCPEHVSLRKKLNESLCENTEEKSHKCDFCDSKAINTDNLKTHIMYQHTKEKNYACHICQKNFSTKVQVNRHLQVHIGEKPYKCDLRDYRPSDNGNLKKHLLIKHIKEKNYTCHICQKNFSSKVEVNTHLRVHTGEKPYKCDLCEYRTSQQGNLKTHLKFKHLKEKSYKCHTCQENFVTKSILNRHLQVHTGEKPYKCDLCDYRAADSGSLKKHLMFTHKKEKNYSCHTCQKNFVTKDSLRRHLRVHTGEKPYKCELCDYCTSHSGNLKTHLKYKHMKEKNFECDICQKNFVREADLNIHLQVHTGEKRYKCDLCDYRATYSGNVKRHLLIKHKEKNYECDICQKKFTTKNQLNKHQHIHTGEKLYKCDLCDYWTSHGGNFKTHLKYKHIKEKNYECDICQKNFVREADLNIHVLVHTGEKRYKCHLCDHGVSASESLKKHIILKHS